MATLTELNFDLVEQALRTAGALSAPAEIHGELCGSMCLLGKEAEPSWAAHILADGHEPRAAELLKILASRTWGELEEGDISFRLLLPSDDRSLELRADSLSLWCQGFLHGLGAGENQGQLKFVYQRGVTKEIIRDFSEITRAAFDESETEEEAEAAYTELVEYVRVCVQLVFEEFYRIRTQPPGSETH
jgi:uncharacterized protein YgfB (UPF0149 family)